MPGLKVGTGRSWMESSMNETIHLYLKSIVDTISYKDLHSPAA